LGTISETAFTMKSMKDMKDSGSQPFMIFMS